MDPQCSHRCSKVYGHMVVQRGNRFDIMCFGFFLTQGLQCLA